MVTDGNSETGLSPVELMAAALASCMGTDVAHILAQGRQGLEGLDVEIVADRAEDNPHRFVRVRLHFAVKGEVNPAQLERAIQLSHEKYCSVWHSMRQDIPLECTSSINPGEHAAEVLTTRISRLAARRHRAGHDRGAHLRRLDAGDASARGRCSGGSWSSAAWPRRSFSSSRAWPRRWQPRRRSSAGESAGEAARRVERRGWQMFLLAFLFRLQSFVLGGFARPATLLKVDILNIMGPAIACTAALWGSASTRRHGHPADDGHAAAARDLAVDSEDAAALVRCRTRSSGTSARPRGRARSRSSRGPGSCSPEACLASRWMARRSAGWSTGDCRHRSPPPASRWCWRATGPAVSRSCFPGPPSGGRRRPSSRSGSA